MSVAQALPYPESGWERSVAAPASTTALVHDIVARWPDLAAVAPGGFVAALVRAYRDAGGVLSGGWRRTAELLDLFNLVGLLGQEGERPIRQADLLRRVDATLQRG